MTDVASDAPKTCPIPPEALSAAVQKTVGAQAPAPLRMMAARGMAPMAPKDLVTAQFVLTFDSDEKIRQAAEKSLSGLDDRIANAVLADATLSPFVLGHLAISVAAKDLFVEKLLLNPATPSWAFIEVGKVCTENSAEIIANNQARLLEQPEIARSLTKNPAVIKSTIDRVVDFLIRNSVMLENSTEFEHALLRLTGEERLKAADAANLDLAMIDERYLTDEQKKELEQRGRRMIAEDADPDDPDSVAEEEKKTVEEELSEASIGKLVALATKGKPRYRRYLLRHVNPLIALAALTSPATRENEVVGCAQSRVVHADIINHISKQKEWMRLYAIKLALVQNPKTLLPTAMRLVPHLNKKDIKLISKSKNVPIGVRTLANNLAKAGQAE